MPGSVREALLQWPFWSYERVGTNDLYWCQCWRACWITTSLNPERSTELTSCLKQTETLCTSESRVLQSVKPHRAICGSGRGQPSSWFRWMLSFRQTCHWLKEWATSMSSFDLLCFFRVCKAATHITETQKLHSQVVLLSIINGLMADLFSTDTKFKFVFLRMYYLFMYYLSPTYYKYRGN